MSIFDVAGAALLVFLGLPLILLSCKVALDSPLAGAAFTLGVAATACVLLRHAGSRLVAVTLAVVALWTLALATATCVGLARGRRRAA